MNWEIVMGLEVHVELATKSKIFCSCTTAFGGAPNTHCCPVCMGMPGTLPVFNEQVLDYALKAGVALNCEITRYNKFDRKNYFYPDLPKAYQISQLYLPFARNGAVEIETKAGSKTIRIHEIHMEEDAGKLIHSPFGDATYPDYNRCGVPLIEIVSEPDFRSAEEVLAYLAKLKSTFEYLGISDVKMEEGSMRADVNLSVRPVGSETFGTRTEMKNINSFKSIERAIAFESKRQIELLEAGEKVVQQTRRWDENKGKTFSMRSKEDAQDYRYFPEPDIPPLRVSEETLTKIKNEQPEFAGEKAERYVRDYGLAKEDAQIIAASKHLAKLFDDTVAISPYPKEIRYWMLSEILYFINEKGLKADNIGFSAEKFAAFIEIMAADRVNKPTGKIIFEEMLKTGDAFDIEGYIKANQLEQVDDGDLIQKTVREVIAANPKTVEQYKNGQTKVLGFFVGQTMKALGGKAKPESVNRYVKEELDTL
ncbi:MAG: Asp-tRNA(Asn)/Glu-tRNA(Gln) amidotransferase subunit GatB [Clostridiales bacterium]|nr:Asp-tRNA(Asn)/Glu-tRNA(Gln) amidotransferase subunit GatB [Clostridiales bacterium]